LTTTPDNQTTTNRRLRLASAVTLIALLAQFLLGMAVNLFVQIPKNHPGARPPEYFSGAAQSVAWAVSSGPLWLLLHASFGLLLVLGAAAVLALAIASRKTARIVAAAVGLTGVLAAGFNGASFLNYDEDFSSMLMSAGFAVAVAAYTLGLLTPDRLRSDP
jgi:hypothetical protein